jgi:hypothetical protein
MRSGAHVAVMIGKTRLAHGPDNVTVGTDDVPVMVAVTVDTGHKLVVDVVTPGHATDTHPFAVHPAVLVPVLTCTQSGPVVPVKFTGIMPGILMVLAVVAASATIPVVPLSRLTIAPTGKTPITVRVRLVQVAFGANVAEATLRLQTVGHAATCSVIPAGHEGLVIKTVST